MKKAFKLIALVFSCAVLLTSLTACGMIYDLIPDPIFDALHHHNYRDKVTPATCTEEGYTTHTCRCGDYYVDSYTSPYGHSFINYVYNGVAPCLTDGTETAPCAHFGCSATDTRTATNTLEHNFNNGICTGCEHYDATPYLTFNFGNDAYSVKAKNANNMPAKIITPNSYEGKAVTAIGDYAFYACDSLTSVVIPDSVTTIGDHAFFGFDSLTSVVIGDNVETIGDAAFLGCGRLTSVVIPDSVTTIGSSAFYWCDSLTSVVIGDSVTTIGSSAFSGCDSLTSITVDENNEYYKSIDGNLYTKDGKILILYALGKTDTSFTIPEGVETIGDVAFSGCDNLTSVVIPDSVTTIGYGAFHMCNSLTSITVDENNEYYKSIDGNLYTKDGKTLIQYAFGKTDTLFTIPEGVETIGYDAFYWCNSLTSVVISDSVTTIGNNAFDGCDSLTSVYYNGSAEEWANISKGVNNSSLTSATRYYYSKDIPTDTTYNYWHYDENGKPVAW